jgi:predicted nucleotidyltransferase
MLASAIEPVVEKARHDQAVLAVILFGSQARGEAQAASDLDVCLVLDPSRATKDDQLAARESYVTLVTKRLDIHVFQQLPLYIRSRVLREGRVLFCRDETRLYDLAYRTAQAFEDFKPYYRRYLEQVARAGS